MDDIGLKIQAILSVYSGREWERKLLGMTDTQVTAIYLRLKRANKI